MGLEDGDPREGGSRGRGTKGKWVKRKGNTREDGLRERGTEERCVKRKGNPGKMG
jgi:hypothetical protein